MPLLLEHKVIRDQRVIIDQPDLNALGAGLVLLNCEIEIRVPASRLSIGSVEIENCTVRTKLPLVNLRWLRARIRNTRFLGVYKGNDFGNDDESGGSAEALDFSGARLDFCAVYGVPVNDFLWPGWPCFTVLDPAIHLSALVPPFASWFPELGETPCHLSALSLLASGVMKSLQDPEMTADQLRAALPDASWLKR